MVPSVSFNCPWLAAIPCRAAVSWEQLSRNYINFSWQVCLQLHRNTRYYRYCRYHSGRIVRKEPVCPVSPGLIFTGPRCQHNTRFITMATLQYFITIHTAACDSCGECAGAGTRILESWLHDDLTDDIMYWPDRRYIYYTDDMLTAQLSVTNWSVTVARGSSRHTPYNYRATVHRAAALLDITILDILFEIWISRCFCWLYQD